MTVCKDCGVLEELISDNSVTRALEVHLRHILRFYRMTQFENAITNCQRSRVILQVIGRSGPEEEIGRSDEEGMNQSVRAKLDMAEQARRSTDSTL